MGKTSHTPDKRFKVHLSEARRNLYDSYFHRSIRKHGPESFSLVTLETLSSEPEAYEREIYWIDTLKCLAPNGYNSVSGGKGGSYNPSEELREKLSVAKRGKPSPQKGFKTKYLIKNTKDGRQYNARGHKNLYALCRILKIPVSKFLKTKHFWDWDLIIVAPKPKT